MIGSYKLLHLFGISSCFFTVTVTHEAILGAPKANNAEQLPYQVSIQIHRKHHICGGAIIDEQYVLTAAHCTLNRTSHLRSKNIFVVAGTISLSKTDPPAVTTRVRRVFYPNGFYPVIEFSPDDIAVLKVGRLLVRDELAQRLRLNGRNLKKLELPRNPYPNSNVRISGFGWNTYSEAHGSTDGFLRFSTVTMISNDECERAYPQMGIRLGIHFCATIQSIPLIYFADRGSVCKGDSGGPLVFNETILIGILSRVSTDCHERKPIVYTSVGYYFTRILNVIEHGHDPHVISERV